MKDAILNRLEMKITAAKLDILNLATALGQAREEREELRQAVDELRLMLTGLLRMELR